MTLLGVPDKDPSLKIANLIFNARN